MDDTAVDMKPLNELNIADHCGCAGGGGSGSNTVFRLDLGSNITTFERMDRALDEVQRSEGVSKTQQKKNPYRPVPAGQENIRPESSRNVLKKSRFFAIRVYISIHVKLPVCINDF